MIESILSERQNTYGEFIDNATISQLLKDVLKKAPSYSRLTPIQKESLEMMMSKVSRIVCGDPNYKDSWVDIAGFATLGGEGM